MVAREVLRWESKQSVTLTQDDVTFPAALSALVPGDYYLQAVLDVDHSYNYNGRGADASELRCQSHRALPHRVVHPWVWW